MLSSYATITPYSFLPSLRRISSATVAHAQAHRAAASRADRAGSFIAKVSRSLLHGASGAEFEVTRKLTFLEDCVWRPTPSGGRCCEQTPRIEVQIRCTDRIQPACSYLHSLDGDLTCEKRS